MRRVTKKLVAEFKRAVLNIADDNMLPRRIFESAGGTLPDGYDFRCRTLNVPPQGLSRLQAA